MVGMVVTISPNFSLYRIVVLPAASKPTATEGGREGGRGRGRMATGARAPLEARGGGAARTADGDGGGQPGHLQVFPTLRAWRAVWVASAHGGPLSGRAGGPGVRGRGPRSPPKSPVRAESSLLTASAGAEGASPHPGPQLQGSGRGDDAPGRHLPEGSGSRGQGVGG